MGKMSISRAAEVYEDRNRKIKVLEAEKDEAAKALKEWFRAHSDRRDYKGLIGYSTGVRHQLDTAAVKAFLGQRLSKFERVVPFEQLSLLR